MISEKLRFLKDLSQLGSKFESIGNPVRQTPKIEFLKADGGDLQVQFARLRYGASNVVLSQREPHKLLKRPNFRHYPTVMRED